MEKKCSISFLRFSFPFLFFSFLLTAGPSPALTLEALLAQTIPLVFFTQVRLLQFYGTLKTIS